MRYITPDDPAIQQMVQETLAGWWRWAYNDFNALREWVAMNIYYKSDPEVHGVDEFFQLPAETLKLRSGDCEDFAFLLVSLLRAYGVPADQVYVGIGQSADGEVHHAYVVERWYTGEWRAIEPQAGVWTTVLLGEMLEDYELYLSFNDQEYIEGWPRYPFPRYWLGGYPILTVGRVYLEKHFNAGTFISGVVRPVPGHEDTSIWRSWGVRVRDPQGWTVVDRGGNVDQVSFSFWCEENGRYELEIWNGGYPQLVELGVTPAGWTFVKGENDSRESK